MSVTEIHPAALAMILLGVILSVSIFADVIADRTPVPRISVLVLVGLGVALIHQGLLGQDSGELLDGLSEPLIKLALVMVAFLLGSELTLDRLKATGSLILVLSITVVLSSALVVGTGLWLLGFAPALAIALGAISVATDPAAVAESIRERGETGLRARLLLGIVAIDDAWGILTFGLGMAILGWLLSSEPETALLHAGWELGGAALLGTVLGLPAAFLTGRLSPGRPTQVEAIALMLLMAGLSAWLGVSEILTAMVAGMWVANGSRHHTQSFREVEYIEWPFLVFFFVLSGASIQLDALDQALGLTLAYLVLRFLGRFLGGWLGVQLPSLRDQPLPRNLGLALTPQAGVAIGMALLAAERYPNELAHLLPAVIASTLVFEAIGPWLVTRVLRRA